MYTNGVEYNTFEFNLRKTYQLFESVMLKIRVLKMNAEQKLIQVLHNFIKSDSDFDYLRRRFGSLTMPYPC